MTVGVGEVAEVLCSTGVMRLASSWWGWPCCCCVEVIIVVAGGADGATCVFFRLTDDIWVVVDFRLMADNIPDGALPEAVSYSLSRLAYRFKFSLTYILSFFYKGFFWEKNKKRECLKTKATREIYRSKEDLFSYM